LGRAHGAAAASRRCSTVGRVGKRLLRRPEAGRKVRPPLLPFFADFASSGSTQRVPLVRGAAAAAEALAVAVLQPQPDRQIGLAALAGKAVQAPLQVLQQALGLLAVAGHLLAVLLQAAAFAIQRGLDALVDRAFPRAQALVLALLVLVVVERRLQLGAQLLDLGHQRGDGIARRVALDAQRLHLLGRERLARAGRAWRRAPGEQLDADEQQHQRHRDQQPLQERLLFIARSSFGLAGRGRRQVHVASIGESRAAATRPGRGHG
jgi:hypothetical protein